MRGLFGSSVRRAGVVCLVTGFLSGLLTMNIFGRGTFDRRHDARQVVLMQQRSESAVVVDDHRGDHGDQGHLHDHAHDHAHDYAHDYVEKNEEIQSAGVEDQGGSNPTIDSSRSESTTSAGR